MGQPEEGLDVKLLSPLTGDAESPAAGSKGLGIPVQAIAGADNKVEGEGKSSHQSVEGFGDDGLFRFSLGVRCLLGRRWGEEYGGVGAGLATARQRARRMAGTA